MKPLTFSQHLQNLCKSFKRTQLTQQLEILAKLSWRLSTAKKIKTFAWNASGSEDLVSLNTPTVWATKSGWTKTFSKAYAITRKIFKMHIPKCACGGLRPCKNCQVNWTGTKISCFPACTFHNMILLLKIWERFTKNVKDHFVFSGRLRAQKPKLLFFFSTEKGYPDSGCVQGWIIPFMSRYKLSNSVPFGSEKRHVFFAFFLFAKFYVCFGGVWKFLSSV